MCVVSMIGDHYHEKWKTLPYQQQPPYNPGSPLPTPPIGLGDIFKDLLKPSPISREEFEALRKDVLEMKELLKKAIEYDKKNNEPHCEVEEKIKTLKLIASWVGVDLSDVFGGSGTISITGSMGGGIILTNHDGPTTTSIVNHDSSLPFTYTVKP